MMLKRLIWILFFSTGFGATYIAEDTTPVTADRNIPFYDRNYAWVDSMMEAMTLDQKIGQLFMVAAYSNQDAAHQIQIETLIKKYDIGGLIFMQGGPVRQINLTNRYQSVSDIPLLIAMDAEWGPAMRLDSIAAFQRQLTWGAIQDDSVIYNTGKIIAAQLKRLGVHVSFSPVVDINNNPANPVIGDRSFGEDKFNVALKGVAYTNGLQENGIIACAKHFPGHGDTDADSHLSLPTVNASKARLDSLELYPFKILMNEGVGSVMLAHLFVPALDDTKNQASSLSPIVGRTLLRDSLGFRGLTFSDALNMKGVSMYYQPGELEVQAFLAGNDVLLFSSDIPTAFNAIKKAIESGKITEQQLDASVTRILKAKAFAGLDKFKPISNKNVATDLNTTEAKLQKRKITEQSITFVIAKNKLIPFVKLDTLSIASLSIGDGSRTDFQTYIDKYAVVNSSVLNKDASSSSFDATYTKLKTYESVIIGIHGTSRSASKNFGINQNTFDLVKKLADVTDVTLVIFGTPYAATNFKTVQNLVVCYDNDNYTQQCAAMALFGAIPFKGKLPVGAGQYKVNSGISTAYLGRIQYSIPEDVGIASERLQKIDSLAKACIDVKAAPGCQILVAKNGKVIWDKSYGYTKYDKKEKITEDYIYDLASVTKICATTLAMMQEYDKGNFDVTKEVDDYLEDTKGSKIGNLKMTDVLTHQAGLVAWIPFYKKTLNADKSLNALYYNQNKIPGFEIPVADNIYMRDDYRDTMWQIIKDTPLKQPGKYVYSDLTMFICRRIVEKITGVPLDKYVNEHFYAPLGLKHTGFNPLDFEEKKLIVPTEDDNYFRYQVVQGYVHDMGAAMMGGVEGHAGLFSNSEDIAIILQMLLNGGSYGGESYFSTETVEKFTGRYSTNSRRGFGFDKPEKTPGKSSPASDYASAKAFGHLGFTGICVWADPEYDLIYIFLSNRVYPKADPNKLSSEGIRNKIMDVIYQSFLGSNADTTMK